MIDVSCAVIIQDGKIFAAQRSALMSLPFKWEFPGGKVEPNETAEESLVREIKEELDVSIEITEKLKPVIHSYGAKHIRLIPFTSQIIAGEIKLKEHQACRWLSLNELLDVDWAEADIPILKDLIKMQS